MKLINKGEKVKSTIEWVSCKKRLPEVADAYLVIIMQKDYYEEEWHYYTDVAQNYGSYIDDYWDTFNDWIEGQETHVIYWAEMPLPLERRN